VGVISCLSTADVDDSIILPYYWLVAITVHGIDKNVYLWTVLCLTDRSMDC